MSSAVKDEPTAPSPDEVEDEVMNTLPALSADELEAVCGVVDIVVEETAKGKKRVLLKMAMKHLCTVTAEDDKMTEFLRIYTHLETEHNKKVTAEETDIKTRADEEAAAAKKKSEEEAAAAKKKSEEEAAVVVEKKSVADSMKKVTKSDADSHVKTKITGVYAGRPEVEALKIKDFKMNGTIGNPGCKDRITYSSLMYQVENGRKMKFSDAEISAGIIKNLQSDLDLKTLFELEPDISLDTILDMLRSCYTEPDSGALYTEFIKAVQLETETAQKFISRLMVLLKKVQLSEDCSYDETMLQKRFFHVMFTGLRDESFRSQLREKCKEDYTLERKTILKYVAEIANLERERNEKLFPKTASAASVNMVQNNGGNKDGEGVCKVKKVKEGNPFMKIDELRTEMRAEFQKEKAELKAELCEIKNILSNNQNQTSQNQNFQNQNLQQQNLQNQNFQNRSNFQNQNQNFQNRSNFQNQNQNFQNANTTNLNPGVQNFVPRSRWKPRKCPNCVSTNAFRCFHCWTCGSNEHKSLACPGIDVEEEKNE